jgi:hypothetical protein
MRYDGASAAAAKSKKVQPSSTLKVSIIKLDKFRKENLKNHYMECNRFR